jgi:hypothetical protein
VLIATAASRGDDHGRKVAVVELQCLVQAGFENG